jgi:hypothetical protein
MTELIPLRWLVSLTLCKMNSLLSDSFILKHMFSATHELGGSEYCQSLVACSLIFLQVMPHILMSIFH